MKDSATAGLRVYIVGGAVRDELLGLPAGDRDWVVVGATPQEMVARGFQPVGEDFPVFLHPVTREEYALARTERKSGRGYKGFTFYTGTDVTLEQDLRRRDLTVNAIAREPGGTLVDPLQGVADLKKQVLRHVGPAFAEDPVRILRLARFAARFAAFTVAPETLALCRAMVAAGEADALVPERVWKEVSRGLMTASPARMLEVLEQAEALPRVMPSLDVTARVRGALDAAARAGLPLASRYALMCLDSSRARTELAARMRVPSECADYARLLPEVLQGLDAVRQATGDVVAGVAGGGDATGGGGTGKAATGSGAVSIDAAGNDATGGAATGSAATGSDAAGSDATNSGVTSNGVTSNGVTSNGATSNGATSNGSTVNDLPGKLPGNDPAGNGVASSEVAGNPATGSDATTRVVPGSAAGRTEAMLQLLERCDALRKPDRFIALLQAAALLAPVDVPAWALALQAVRGVDAGAIARACQGEAGRIKPALRAARLQALQPGS